MGTAKRKQVIANNHLVSYVHVPATNSFLPTLVFLHGWRSQAALWKEVVSILEEKGFGAVALDLPGFGQSETPKHPFSLNDYALTVEEAVRKIGLTRVVVVGHSFGGRIGIKLAVRKFDLLEKLVLIDSGGIRIEEEKVNIYGNLAKLVKPFFKPSFMKPARKKIYTMMGAEDYLATPELQETFKRIVEEDLTKALKKVSVPTHLIWGREDEETPLEAGKIMEKEIPHASLTVFNEAGHYAFLDNPSESAEIIDAFVRS